MYFKYLNLLKQPNEIVIELNEKLAKLQLTVSKQAERIKQLEQEKAELESKCQGKAKVAVGTPSNYKNPLCKVVIVLILY